MTNLASILALEHLRLRLGDQPWRRRDFFLAIFAHIEALARSLPRVVGLRLQVKATNLRAQRANRACDMHGNKHIAMERFWNAQPGEMSESRREAKASVSCGRCSRKGITVLAVAPNGTVYECHNCLAGGAVPPVPTRPIDERPPTCEDERGTRHVYKALSAPGKPVRPKLTNDDLESVGQLLIFIRWFAPTFVDQFGIAAELVLRSSGCDERAWRGLGELLESTYGKAALERAHMRYIDTCVKNDQTGCQI